MVWNCLKLFSNCFLKQLEKIDKMVVYFNPVKVTAEKVNILKYNLQSVNRGYKKYLFVFVFFKCELNSCSVLNLTEGPLLAKQYIIQCKVSVSDCI